MTNSILVEENEFAPRTRAEENDLKALRVVLNRFSKEDLMHHVLEEHLDFCRLIPREGMKAKRTTVQQMCKIALNIISKKTPLKDLTARLDLLYTVLHQEKKAWTVYEFSKGGTLFTSYIEVIDDLQGILQSYYLQYHLCGMLFEGSLCFRLSFPTKKAYNKVVYLHHSPGIRLILMSGKVEKQLMPILLEALSETFGSTKIEQLNVKHSFGVANLYKMALQKNGHLLTEPTHLPQCIQNGHKLRERRQEPISGHVNLDFQKKLERRAYLDGLLGKYEAPRIRKFTIEAETKFFGYEDEDNDEDKFVCKMEFTGSNVIEGLCNMNEEGVISPKLPHFLENIAIGGTTSIRITDE